MKYIFLFFTTMLVACNNEKQNFTDKVDSIEHQLIKYQQTVAITNKNSQQIVVLTNAIKVLENKVDALNKQKENELLLAIEKNKQLLNTDKLNLKGESFGGKLRAAPWTNSQQIGSVYEGEKVRILSRTEVMEHGYYWFKIQLENGLNGYQWGGLLCAYNISDFGAYKQCR